MHPRRPNAPALLAALALAASAPTAQVVARGPLPARPPRAAVDAPARCGVGCDTTPTIPYVYEYVRRPDGLVMSTVGATPDVTCTAYGQSNPITYTYAPVP